MTHYLEKIFYTTVLLLRGLCANASGCYEQQYAKYDLITKEGELYIQAAVTTHFIHYAQQACYKLEGIVPNNLRIINRTADMILFSVDDGYYMFHIENNQCTNREQMELVRRWRPLKIKNCRPAIEQVARIAKGEFSIIKLYEKHEVSEIADNWFFNVQGKWYYPRLPTDPKRYIPITLSPITVVYNYPYYGKLLVKINDVVYFFSVETGLKEISKAADFKIIFQKDEVLITKDTSHVYFLAYREAKMYILPKLDPSKTIFEEEYIEDDSTGYHLYRYYPEGDFEVLTSKFRERAYKRSLNKSNKPKKENEYGVLFARSNEYINDISEFTSGYSARETSYYYDGEYFRFARGAYDTIFSSSIKLDAPPKLLGTAVAYNDRLLIGGKTIENPSTIDKLEFLGSTVDTRNRCGEPFALKFYSFFKDDQHVYYCHSGDTKLSIIEGLRPMDYQVDDYEQLALLMRKLMCPLQPMREAKLAEGYIRIQVAFSKHLNTNSRDFSELKKRFFQVDYIKEKDGYRYVIGIDCLTNIVYSKDLLLFEIQKIIPDAKIYVHVTH